ncbi:hypothetical protein CPC16_011537 [Podila verticillata]|nr:hypothetical protein CPC16_011537 [Podila verticillata]KFH63952.1 hypothetical protein MVEG_09777 [Podila verticillata NRRL 6337]
MTSQQNLVPPIPFPQTEINIAALEDVKTRLSQLQESIVYFLRSITPENVSPVSWTELHSKFNVLIAKYVHLTNLLNGPHNNLLQSYTVFPHDTPTTDQYVQTMSVLLRTKLTPELEQEDEDRTKEGNIPGMVASPSAGAAEERRILAALKLKISMHDALCQAVDEIFENQRDTVHTRVRYESEDEGQAKAGGLPPQKATHTVEELDALNFLDSIQGSQVRYLDDWAGSVVDTPGYESDEQWSDQEEAFGNTHADIQELQRNSDYYESSDSEMEEEEDIPEAQAQPVAGQEIEEDEEDEDEDAFMEVAAESPAFGSMSGVIPGSGMIMEDLGGGDDEDEGESDDEEEMEEVQ